MSDPNVKSVFHPQFGEIIFSQLTPEMCQWLINNGFTGLMVKPLIPEPKKT